MRPTWIEVDLAAIRHNISQFVEFAAPAEVMAVVKADGYGHGDVPVALAALDAGAGSLAVALISEGIRLREAGITAPILLLTEPPKPDVEELVRWDITPSVFRAGFLEAVDDRADLAVEVVIDTGMHRVGATEDEALDLVQAIVDHPGVTLAGVWTHFAVAESSDDFNATQISRFEEAVERIRGLGIEPGAVHLSNTAGALHLAPAASRVRIGLGMYGLYPDPTRRPVELKPAMRVVSHVSHVRRYSAGTRPSYGRIRPLEGDANVATVPIGYADGVPRILSAQGGEMLAGGRRCPLAGNVTMDQVMLDCGDQPVAVGDEVVLIGTQGSEELGVDEWAELAGTISYEIVSGMGPRLPRKYSG